MRKISSIQLAVFDILILYLLQLHQSKCGRRKKNIGQKRKYMIFYFSHSNITRRMSPTNYKNKWNSLAIATDENERINTL